MRPPLDVKTSQTVSILIVPEPMERAEKPTDEQRQPSMAMVKGFPVHRQSITYEA